ncbi:cysteine proteinase inhibitor 1-like [Olea europaea var. sylvestris]|uniref:cysteine proteinase inhibitor 1-like n=1 Tax=Olea europaea var. sylvestris TaxID=158386 RepID=UPI000C1CFC2F|nr:cysteine proteinase inhibitor 1-like [Olea europaea var. sylvestris]
MRLKSLTILLIILPILMDSIQLSTALGGRTGGLAGGWRPIENLNDLKVQKIAKYAVQEHNKQAKSKLQFLRVVKGETQVVAGTNYKLVISAKDGAVPHNYEAVVWEKPWEKFRKLTSFEELKG